MHVNAFITLTAALTLGLTACSESNEATAPPAPDTEAAPVETADEATQAAAEAAYPLDTCAVSGEKLGSMGDPVVLTIDNRTVKLCCSGCESQLREEPAKYLAMLDAAKAGTHAPHDEAHDHQH